MTSHSLVGNIAGVIIAVGLLDGCGNAQLEAQQVQAAERNAKVAACIQQFDRQHQVDRHRCITSVHEAYISTYTYPDLVRLGDAQNQGLAVKVDAGQITRDEARLQAARTGAEITSMEEQRNAVRAGANAARLQAAAAVQSAVRVNQPAPYNPWPAWGAGYQPRPSVNCLSNANGNFVSTTCN